MKTLLPTILTELAQGRAVALATVLQAKGSAPRGAGACQALTQSGKAVGTVGGGVLERRALDELQALLNANARQSDENAHLDSSLQGQSPAHPSCVNGAISERICVQADYVACDGCVSRLQEYALTQNEVLSLGMVCGGNVMLLYQLLTPAMLPFLTAIQAQLDKPNGSLWLVRCLKDGHVLRMAYSDGQSNPTPYPDAEFQSLCGRRARWVDSNATLADASLGDLSCFVEPVRLDSHAYLFGGGHVAQCVAHLLAQLDFSPVIYDDRPEFTDPTLFPNAAGVVCAPFADAGNRLRITAEDEIVIMTRGHVNDLQTLTQALRTPAYYIGLIGSRSKIAHTKNMLLAQGFSEADFARVHTPIGLPILAETPMEIAVSVAAEMILCRAKRAADSVESPTEA